MFWLVRYILRLLRRAAPVRYIYFKRFLPGRFIEVGDRQLPGLFLGSPHNAFVGLPLALRNTYLPRAVCAQLLLGVRTFRWPNEGHAGWAPTAAGAYTQGP